MAPYSNTDDDESMMLATKLIKETVTQINTVIPLNCYCSNSLRFLTLRHGHAAIYPQKQSTNGNWPGIHKKRQDGQRLVLTVVVVTASQPCGHGEHGGCDGAAPLLFTSRSTTEGYSPTRGAPLTIAPASRVLA